MRDHEQHLSEEELILAADNELGRKTRKAQVHLESCAPCRNRAAQFQGAITELAHAQTRSLDSELPSIAGPRAMLRTRMSEMSARKESKFSRPRLSPRWLTGALSMGAIASLAVGAFFMNHRTAPDEITKSAERDIRPNRAFTPGVARQVSLERVCSLPREEVVKPVSPLQRQKVFQEYGIPLDQADKYEVDYLVTPGLGGDDDIRNLWPEPYNITAWNAHVKDALEERLHEMVCSHQLDIAEAQKAIATDWIAAYEKYVRASGAAVPATRRSVSHSLVAFSISFALDVAVGIGRKDN